MSTENKTIILNHDDILLKIERMATQVVELNPSAKKIILVGIENKGLKVAQLIQKALLAIRDIDIVIGSIKIDKRNPDPDAARLSGVESTKDEHVILIDDILNSGRTMMYASLPIMKQSPKSLHTLFLANRDHASFPIQASIVGISLATTLQEHITFDIDKSGQMTVYLT